MNMYNNSIENLKTKYTSYKTDLKKKKNYIRYKV